MQVIIIERKNEILVAVSMFKDNVVFEFVSKFILLWNENSMDSKKISNMCYISIEKKNAD